ncbi:MAG TPA: peptidoglycan DD-metalloendopeptidase family protein [Actinomycetota bacterium]|nr:peptidoglycan DD-metalloendopeptidase family protein [Actinomycetota bacterium]
MIPTLLAFSAVTAVAVPAPAATQQELAKARAERAAVQRQLDQTVAAYDAAQARLAETQASIDRNKVALEEAEVAQKAAQERLSMRADVMYRRGPVAIFQYLMGAETFSDFGRRLTLVRGAARQDSTTIAAAQQTKQEISNLQERLLAEQLQQQALLTSMSSQTRSLTENFTKAQTIESRLVADREAALKAERDKAAKAAAAAKAAEAAKASAAAAAAAKAKTEAARKPSPGPGASASPSPATARLANTGPVVPAGTRRLFCPVDGPVSFTDTYGAPRSGGRKHQGVDMFAPMRTPVAAIVDGTLTRRESSALGGLSVYMKGTDGTEYFYTHLSGYSNVAPGQKVTAGQTIGYVGDTGNAAGGPPHLHFEVRSGGVPVNPTPTARAACG